MMNLDETSRRWRLFGWNKFVANWRPQAVPIAAFIGESARALSARDSVTHEQTEAS